MRKTIGIVGGGFKPFTKGHYFLVEKAAGENDEVILLVSTSNRIRKEELPILWSQMEEVWKKYLTPSMPANVSVQFVSNPTRAAYELLGEADLDEGNHNTYVLYADDQDMTRMYADDKLEKYMPRLVQNEQIEKRAFSRAENVDISGTQMRDYVNQGDVAGFASGLPGPVQRYGQEIFDILKNTPELPKPAPRKKRPKRI
jgi:cytidyltransferase-like protein